MFFEAYIISHKHSQKKRRGAYCDWTLAREAPISGKLAEGLLSARVQTVSCVVTMPHVGAVNDSLSQWQAHAMSLPAWRMPSITSKEAQAMFQNSLFALYEDPDVLVFWLTTTLFALFALFAPGGPAAL